MTHRSLLLPVFLLTPLAAQGIWTQLTPAATPSPRRSHAMAFDLLSGGTILYGGLATGNVLSNETWSFDGTNWTLLTPATTPPARWGHKMVRDTVRNRLVVFGGRSPTITANANDTWIWNGFDWQQIVTTTQPTVRAFYSMAYDQRRDRVVLTGAMSTLVGAQVWEFDGSNWAQNGTTPFGPRDEPLFVYDAGRGVCTLFGGWNASTAVMGADTWDFDGTNWTQLAPATSPSARYRTAHWYDSRRGRVVMHGGSTGFTETWEFDGNTWTMASNIGPGLSSNGAGDFDLFRAFAVHFGGNGPGGTNGLTSAWAGPETAIAAPFGRGCTGSAGQPTANPSNAPVLGNTWNVAIGSLPMASAGVLAAMGFSNHVWAFGALPADLTPFGVAGCRLEVSVDATFFVPASGSAATLSAGVPNLPGLIGLPLFVQALSPDAAAPNGFGAMTNAVHGVIGN
ncbi:MAG: hypothetical protein IPK26_20120 [Planctomycetes bacterium]|nr:hypothetical protein [Planctomycetota bacterium]